MTTLIIDPLAEADYLADRRAKGLDRYDEVWDGVYIVSPLPEYYHQEIVGDLNSCLQTALRRQKLGRVVPGCNISDRAGDWMQNYRCPDVVVFLTTTTAKFHGAHWEGGPDFAVEVVSENDRTWDKLDFYAKVGTRELLIVDRKPWQLTLLRLQEGSFIEVGTSTQTDQVELPSAVIPFTFRLVKQPYGPAIEIKNVTDGQISYAPADPPLPTA
ncbi:Uma2 family endonuclease [Anatilimnocola floriformis]|uniref:Uma2 family endonuclease n=1 Tax=Anatilimnocola floriformis TaxID=2948575 RepID=UPI0020C588E9|nr:Uma2 family endonuclease [Anatilimnocola floriformis]